MLIFKQTRLVLISATKYQIRCSYPGLRSWALGQESHPPIWTGACSWPWGWQERSAASQLWGLFQLRVDLGVFIARFLPSTWKIWHKTKGISSPSLVCFASICHLPPPNILSYPRQAKIKQKFCLPSFFPFHPMPNLSIGRPISQPILGPLAMLSTLLHQAIEPPTPTLPSLSSQMQALCFLLSIRSGLQG